MEKSKRYDGEKCGGLAREGKQGERREISFSPPSTYARMCTRMRGGSDGVEENGRKRRGKDEGMRKEGFSFSPLRM